MLFQNTRVPLNRCASPSSNKYTTPGKGQIHKKCLIKYQKIVNKQQNLSDIHASLTTAHAQITVSLQIKVHMASAPYIHVYDCKHWFVRFLLKFNIKIKI